MAVPGRSGQVRKVAIRPDSEGITGTGVRQARNYIFDREKSVTAAAKPGQGDKVTRADHLATLSPQPLARGVGGRLLAQRTAVGDAALAEVVRRQGDGHGVTRQDADEVLAHLARDVGEHLVAVLQPDLEPGVGQCGGHLALDLKGLFFRHQDSSVVEGNVQEGRLIRSEWANASRSAPAPITSVEGGVSADASARKQ